MRTVRLGRTGLKVSEVCLGTMTFGLQTDRSESFAIMDAADEAGIAFIDVADVYPVGGTLETVGRTEEIVGDWMAGKRERFVVVQPRYNLLFRQIESELLPAAQANGIGAVVFNPLAAGNSSLSICRNR